ncbi:MAG: branched-chain amino acid ABC transporter permease [Deltaproteobacteria bacterium]|nr:branched-chain amino acid ABC transporter permease [Deltaproteobacteria bacterium]
MTQRQINGSSLWRSSHSIIILGAVFAVLPFVLPYTALATEIMLFALAAVAFDLCVGYTGVMMFCQASFFGLGAYTTALTLVHLTDNILLAMLFGVAMSTALAALIGFMISIRSGSYSVLLSLAFNELIYFIAYQWSSLTGGDDGLTGVRRPDINLGGFTVDLQSSDRYYYFALFFFILAVWIIRRITLSPLGKIFLCIRENDERAQAIGFNIRLYKTLSVMIGGLFMGLAGSLYSMYIQFAHIHNVHFETSGNIVMMVLIGGIGTLFGPIVGAVMIVTASDLVSSIWDRWMLIMGILFIFFVLFARGGVWSLLEKGFRMFGRAKSE